MKQRNFYSHCCIALLTLTLTACSQQATKDETELNGKVPSDASVSGKKFRISRNGYRSKKLGGKNDYESLWDRLFDLYDLPLVEHEDIDRELNWFLSHPDYLDRVQKRAEPFLYSIVKQLEKHEVPGEIALLPIIESAFQPHVVSPAKAAGIWQFMPATGKTYGLQQNQAYDGRRDIYASTRAAIKYLKKLHGNFNGDWLLAVAAYNCGEGTINKAIQKNLNKRQPTDFWSLDLPQETRAYVPRFLAVAKLFASADQYGVGLHDIPNQALFKTVKLNSQFDLALAADAADISLDKMQELNPGFKQQRAEIDGSYRLFIPAEKKIRDFKEELARLVEEKEILGKPGVSPPFWEKPLELIPTPSQPVKSVSHGAASKPAKNIVQKLRNEKPIHLAELKLSGKKPAQVPPARPLKAGSKEVATKMPAGKVAVKPSQPVKSVVSKASPAAAVKQSVGKVTEAPKKGGQNKPSKH